MSEGCRADMLLKYSRLGRRERATIQASMQNGQDFQKMADALMVSFPRIHVTEVHPQLQDSEQHCHQDENMNEDDKEEKSLVTSMPSTSSEVSLAPEARTKEEENTSEVCTKEENIADDQGGEILAEVSSSEDKRSEKRRASQDEQENVESDGGVQEKVAEMQSACAAKAEASRCSLAPSADVSTSRSSKEDPALSRLENSHDKSGIRHASQGCECQDIRLADCVETEASGMSTDTQLAMIDDECSTNVDGSTWRERIRLRLQKKQADIKEEQPEIAREMQEMRGRFVSRAVADPEVTGTSKRSDFL